MRLQKEVWKKFNLGSIVDELRVNSQNPIEEGYEKYVGFEHIESDNIYLTKYGSLDDGITFKKIFKKNDVLFGKIRAYLNKVAIARFDGICSGDILVLRTKDKNHLQQEILPYYLTTHSFLKCAVDSSIGTTLPRTKWLHLSKKEILLPPIDEQKMIVALFNSIKNAIEQVEVQEKRLKELRKSLINKLVKEKPSFGNIIKLNMCGEYSIGVIAEEISDRTDNPSESGFDKFIGLEDFESGELFIKSYSSPEKLVSAMKICHKGNVLFARRNAYLKRASITEYDAVCSGDVIVIKTNENIIHSKYLVLIMNTDEFWNYAISNATGTMSKRVKWRDLAKFTFVLPDLEHQQSIVKIFEQLESVIDKLRKQRIALKKLKQNLLNEILG